MDGSERAGEAALVDIRELRGALFKYVAERRELPDVSPVLELQSRQGAPERIKQHILQSSLLHWEHFAHVNRIRHIFLLDGFLSAVDDENPIVLYAVSRGMFELSAFLHQVRKRLSANVHQLDGSNWKQVGERYFALIVRARYATSSPELRESLGKAGVPISRLKPFNITHCVQGLASEADNKDAIDRYAQLSDFVHQNLSSALTAHSGARLGQKAALGTGFIITPSEAPIVRYQYPVDSPFDPHLDRAAVGFLRDSRNCIRWINSTPPAPFPFQIERAT